MPRSSLTTTRSRCGNWWMQKVEARSVAQATGCAMRGKVIDLMDALRRSVKEPSEEETGGAGQTGRG